MAICPTTTNQVFNGGAETNTTEITAIGAGTLPTISSSADFAKFGTKSLKCVTAGDGADQGAVWSNPNDGGFAAADICSFSGWVYNPGTTQNFQIRVSWRAAGGGLISEVSSANISCPSGFWQYVKLNTVTAPALTSRAYVKIYRPGTPGTALTFYADGVQAEKVGASTPYVHTDGAIASRSSAPGIQIKSEGMSTTQMWVAIRFHPLHAQNVAPYGGGSPRFFFFGDDANNYIEVYHDPASSQIGVGSKNGAAAANTRALAATWAANSAHTLIAQFLAADLKASYDGAAFSALGSRAGGAPTVTSATAEIGTRGAVTANRQLFQYISWFAWGTGSLSDANAAAIHALERVGLVPARFPGTCKFFWQGVNQKALVQN
jgi:hypothetical protein